MYPSKKLSEICEKITDGTHQTPTYFDSGYIFLSSKNVTSGKIDWDNIKYIDEKQHLEMYKRVTPKKGDILLAKNGTTGVAAIVDRDEIFDIYVSLALLCPKKEVYSEYLLYFINSSQAKKQFNSRLKGVGVPNLHLGEIKEVEIPLPPLSTQFCIVEKLDEAFGNIDKQIVLLKSNIDDVENLAKSILKKIFLEGELVAIEDLVCETKTWNPSIIGEEYFEYIDISSIDNVNYILTDTKTISGIDAPSRAKKLVNPNDIIFATTRPNLKNIAIVDKEIKNLTCSTGFCVLKANENKLFYRYLFYCLISDEMMVCIQPMIRGAQYPAISDKDLKSVQIPLPTLSRQFEIVSLLDALYDKNKQLKSEYEAQIQDLETLKQSLLEEAFAGRLVLDGQ